MVFELVGHEVVVIPVKMLAGEHPSPKCLYVAAIELRRCEAFHNLPTQWKQMSGRVSKNLRHSA